MFVRYLLGQRMTFVSLPQLQVHALQHSQASGDCENRESGRRKELGISASSGQTWISIGFGAAAPSSAHICTLPGAPHRTPAQSASEQVYRQRLGELPTVSICSSVAKSA
jgi:hypothetical protein